MDVIQCLLKCISVRNLWTQNLSDLESNSIKLKFVEDSKLNISELELIGRMDNHLANMTALFDNLHNNNMSIKVYLHSYWIRRLFSTLDNIINLPNKMSLSANNIDNNILFSLMPQTIVNSFENLKYA